MTGSIVTQTRGERNNNPGNLNYVMPGWRGQIGLEIVPENVSYKPRFGRYDTDMSGIRAIAAQLLVYQNKHGLRTLRAMINRWAPPADANDTSAYVRNSEGIIKAATSVYYGPDDNYPLTQTNLHWLVVAIITQENGRCLYPANLIADACRSAAGLS